MASPSQGPEPDDLDRVESEMPSGRRGVEQDPGDGRRGPGLGLRVSLYLLACLTVLQVGSALLLPLLDPAGFEEARVRGDLEPIGLGVLLAAQAVLAPVVVVVTLAFLRTFDRRSPVAIGAGWPRALRASLGGALLAPATILGGWLVSATVLAELRFGGAGDASGATVALYGLGFLLAATAEEWMLRGYVFSTLRTRLAWIHAAGATAALQLLLQWGPRAEASSLANLFLIALGLGALRELTGSLWPGVLFQASWNLLLGSVLSLPVSGFEAPRLFEVALEGERAWTGGAYGPEASWALTSFLLVALVLLVGPLAERDAAEAEAGNNAAGPNGGPDG